MATREATVADGIAVGTPGELTIPLVLRYVDDMVVVEEDEVTQAMMLRSVGARRPAVNGALGALLPSANTGGTQQSGRASPLSTPARPPRILPWRTGTAGGSGSRTAG